MKKLLTTLPLLLLAATLSACGSGDNSSPPPPTQPPTTAPTPIPPTGTFATDTPKPCDPLVYNEPQLLMTDDEGYSSLFGGVDLNGDGYDEILIVRSDWATTKLFEVNILRNDGEGRFELATEDFFEGPVVSTMAVSRYILADFNSDGVTDVFFPDSGMDAEPFPGYQNSLMLSIPGGLWVNATDNLPQQSDFTHSATSGDVDNDGDIDLLLGNFGIHYPPQLWINDGAGNFTVGEGRLPTFYWDNSTIYKTFSWMGMEDVNNDGFKDIILGGFIDNESEVLLNDGQGYFSVLPNALPPKPTAPKNHVLAIDFLDLNEDGYQDLILGYSLNTVGFYLGRYVQILINNGDGTFRNETESRFTYSQPPDNEETVFYSVGLQLLDIDYDGDSDLIIQVADRWDAFGITATKSPQPFYLNDGGVFSPADIDHHLTSHQMFGFLDVYGDGYLDIITIFPEIYTDMYIIHDIGCK